MALTIFLFVKKHGSSQVLTRSENEDKSKVLSYIQARRRKREESERHAEPWAKFVSCLTIDDEDWVRVDEAGSLATSHAFISRQERLVRLPMLYPTNSESDPFYTTVIGIDASTHAILHYTFTTAARMTFRTQAFAPPSIAAKRTWMRHDNTIQERIRHCVEDELVMFSRPAYASCCMAWMAGILDPMRPPEYLIGKALKTVQRQLDMPQQSPDTWLLQSMYALPITELWNAIPMMWTKCLTRHASFSESGGRSLQGARTHLYALCHIPETASGWRSVES